MFKRSPGATADTRAAATNPRWSNSCINNGNHILLESTMSKLEKARTLPRSLYRWSFVVLLPLLALVLSACGSGGVGY